MCKINIKNTKEYYQWIKHINNFENSEIFVQLAKFTFNISPKKYVWQYVVPNKV